MTHSLDSMNGTPEGWDPLIDGIWPGWAPSRRGVATEQFAPRLGDVAVGTSVEVHTAEQPVQPE